MSFCSPPETDRQNIGRNPENPLFSIHPSLEKLSRPIGPIGGTIPEGSGWTNWLLNKTEQEPDD